MVKTVPEQARKSTPSGAPQRGGSSWLGRFFRPLAFLGEWVPGWLRYQYFEFVLPFLRSAFGLLLSPFTFLFRTVYVGVYVLGPWWGSPKLRYLLRGLPALLVGGFAVWITIVGKLEGGAANRGEAYLAAAQVAAKKSEWNKAKIFYQRAIEMGFTSADTKFELVKVAEEDGDLPVKVAVLDSLAPPDRAVFAPAHYWQALKYLSETPVSDEAAELGEQHLLFVLELEPTNAMAHAILGDLYFQRGILQVAAEHLSKAPRQLPLYSLRLARTYLLLGQKDKGKSAASQTAMTAKNLLLSSPRDVETRLQLADALVILDQYEQVQQVLADGIKLNPNDKSLRTAMARMYVAWSDWVDDQPGTPAEINAAVFQLVAAGLEQDANEPMLFHRMMDIVMAKDDTAINARQMMLDNIANGRLVGISHLVLGTALDIEGKPDATDHLSEAFRLLPNGPVVANNLAWHLVVKENPEPDRAERIIARVVDQYPNVAAFRDTFAHVYFRQEKWTEAIREFSATLPEFATVPETHDAMARCYEERREFELANTHREIAAKLRTGTPGAVK